VSDAAPGFDELNQRASSSGTSPLAEPVEGRLPLDQFSVPSNAGPLTAWRVQPVGEKKGNVVFIPGFTGSKEDFRLLLPRMAALGWDTVAYSQRGQYDSAAPAGVENYTLAELAGDAANFALGIFEHCGGELVHLVGHSLGGLVAREAVLLRPDLFASVTMLCSGPGGRPGVHQEDGEFVAEHGPLGIWQRDNPDGAQSEEQVFLRERAAASSPDAYLGGVSILQNTTDSTSALAASGVPALVAHGDTDDAWPISDQKLMAERLGARYAVIPDAGHLPNIDNPDYTARLLSDFCSANS